MLLDAGVCAVYGETKTGWALKSRHFYGERTVGMSRYYTALAENRKTDLLVRIWRDPSVTTTDLCVINAEQYRILQVQHLADEDGLKVTDLSLERLGTHFDIAGI